MAPKKAANFCREEPKQQMGLYGFHFGFFWTAVTHFGIDTVEVDQLFKQMFAHFGLKRMYVFSIYINLTIY